MGNPIEAEELYGKVEAALRETRLDMASRNKLLHEALLFCALEGTKDEGQAFGNLFFRVDYLCKKHGVKMADKVAIQEARRHGNSDEPPTEEDLRYDARAVCVFISAVTNVCVPHELRGLLPSNPKHHEPNSRETRTQTRCIVHAAENGWIRATPDEQGGYYAVCLHDESRGVDNGYIAQLVKEGTQVNLLDCQVEDWRMKVAGEWCDKRVTPRLIVVEPDFPLDISSIATCFTEMGHHPLLYLLNQMKPRQTTQAILLGNFASEALDDVINSSQYRFEETLRENFQANAIDFCACEAFNPAEFKEQARQQAANLEATRDALFHQHEKEKALLEPSFLCEALGLRGRVDLMTTDLQLLVEQKSGRNRNIERNMPNGHYGFHLTPHYVQLLLYYGVLRYNFHMPPGAIDIRLLYSRFPPKQGLLAVSYYQQLFLEAMAYRNQVVSELLDIAQGGFARKLPRFNSDALNVAGKGNAFVLRYKIPEVESVTIPLQQASPLERAYFCRMVTSVIREEVMSKMGGQEGVAHCSADLWSMPLNEKREAGTIYTGLRVIEKTKSEGSKGYDTLTLSIPPQPEKDFAPNFRQGDMAWLYAYREGKTPDVRHSILYHCTIERIEMDRLTVHLRNGQQNPNVMGNGPFALEHADSSGGMGTQTQSLHLFLRSPKDKRDLLLGQRAPRKDETLSLSQSYDPRLDAILSQAKQARDYFLLMGPPGTGKTSRAMRFIVEEALKTGEKMLLMSYTNRAVDEICGMLADNGLPFLRVGNEYSCEERFRPCLFTAMARRHPKMAQIKQELIQAPIIAGTVASICGKPELLAIRHADLAIIDEASQVLEPYLVGLLSQVGRFILIGDHKQLPAVTQQSPRDSVIANDEEGQLLRSIGLKDCRDSLFERLLRWEKQNGRKDFVGILRWQGRMHPEVADFPNRMFYAREKLEPVPCPHQKEPELPYHEETNDALDRQLRYHRVLFIASKDCLEPQLSDKVNTDEARIVAEVAHRLRRFMGEGFNAKTSLGIIVPYRNQISLIRQRLEEKKLPELMDITIDTVERYQGSQRDVIIYSFTIQRQWQMNFLTANNFVEDGKVIDRKLNVALTRAREQMIITGNPHTLKGNSVFAQLMDYCKEKGGYLRSEDI